MFYFKKQFQIFTVLLVCSAIVFAQGGRIVRESIHSVGLEKTVTKETPDRNVSVYLPLSYDGSPAKRYPVVYLLHGIGDTDEVWTKPWTDHDDGYSTVQDLMNRGHK